MNVNTETRAKPSHTLPLCICRAVDWIESVLQLSLLLLGATLSDAACEERRIQTGSLRTLEDEEREEGVHSCHNEL